MPSNRKKYRVWVVHVNSRFSFLVTNTTANVYKNNMKTLIHKREKESWMKIYRFVYLRWAQTISSWVSFVFVGCIPMGRGKCISLLIFLPRFSLIAWMISWIFHSLTTTKKKYFFYSPIFCLAISFFSHITTPATCYLARAYETHINLLIHTMARSQEIITFIKGNLFFNRYFFIFFSLSSPSSQVFYVNHAAFVLVPPTVLSQRTFLDKINLSNETN